MKKYHLRFILALSPFALFSCAKPSIDMPKSPFDDPYIRIGMKGDLPITDSMPQKDYNEIKKYLNDTNSKDTQVSRYIRQEETRDLKYAYFGQESSMISQCLMSSVTEDAQRFKDKVTTIDNINNQQVQSANSGIIKTSTLSTDYIFDDVHRPTNENSTYSHRLKRKNNDEDEVVTESITQRSYDDDTDLETTFGLTPYKNRIKAHFNPTEIREKTYDFKLLGDDNKAIYGMSGDKYLIREGYSLFADFKTTMGRSYKAEDNFLYEGLLEKYKDEDNEDAYRFTNFRFYHELLILSKAFDGTGVPVLYLDKPVLIEYSEVKYEIFYDNLVDYTGVIPEVTK